MWFGHRYKAGLPTSVDKPRGFWRPGRLGKRRSPVVDGKCGSSINKRCLKMWLVGLHGFFAAPLYSSQQGSVGPNAMGGCQKSDSILWRRCLKTWLIYLELR